MTTESPADGLGWPAGAPRHTGGCVPRPPSEEVPPESGAAPRRCSETPGAVPKSRPALAARNVRPDSRQQCSSPAGPVDSKEQTHGLRAATRRSMLDGKDREELHAIAGAMGVKGITRMRKADLVDAILAARRRAAPAARQRRQGEARRTANGAGRREAEAGRAARRRRPSWPRATPASPRSPPRKRRSPGRTPSPRSRRGPHGATAAAAATGDDRGRRHADGRRRRRDAAARRRAGGDRSRGRARLVRRGQPQRIAPAPAPRPRRQGGDRQGGERPPDGGGEPREREFSGEPIEIEGLLDLRDEGYGFLRTTRLPAGPQRRRTSRRRRCGGSALRKGDYVKGATRPPASNEKYPALLRVDQINGMTPRRRARAAPRFEDLTPLFPDSQLRLELADEPGRDHRPDRRPHLADREGPARADRLAAEGGQDDDHQADRATRSSATTPRCT